MNLYENTKIQPAEKPIKITRGKRKPTKAVIKNRLIGIALIIIGLLTMLIPYPISETDGTAFIMLLFIGITALFSKE